jgi:hypothetical protein
VAGGGNWKDAKKEWVNGAEAKEGSYSERGVNPETWKPGGKSME